MEKLVLKGQTKQMSLCSKDKPFQLEITQNKTPCKESNEEKKPQIQSTKKPHQILYSQNTSTIKSVFFFFPNIQVQGKIKPLKDLRKTLCFLNETKTNTYKPLHIQTTKHPQ